MKNSLAKHIHFVGIKGVGMAALAVLAKEAGILVTGSDLGEEFITDSLIEDFRIPWKVGFSPKNIEGHPDLVVVTGAHEGFNNVEAKAAQEKGLKVMMQGEAVGAFMAGKFLGRENLEGISVAGCHGKTTTTAILATILSGCKSDPSYLVGCGGILPLGASGHFGGGKYFIAEADEYATCPEIDQTPKFLWQNPKFLVLTNIEYDHPDVFANLKELEKAFLKLINKLPKNGLLVAGGDSPSLREILKRVNCPVVTFGEGSQNNWRLKKFYMREGKSRFWVESHGRDLGEFEIAVPGKFNAVNALAGIIVALELGFSSVQIKKSLATFAGTKRRFEFIGGSGVKLYDDYAHHPTEISSTLEAAKNFFPGQKITCIFQPHTYSRTKVLLSDFARCFSKAYQVIIVDIYSSAREKDDFGVNSKILTEEIAKYHPRVKYLGKKEKVIDYLKKTADLSGIIFTMGAGDIFLWHEEILAALVKVK